MIDVIFIIFIIIIKFIANIFGCIYLIIFLFNFCISWNIKLYMSMTLGAAKIGHHDVLFTIFTVVVSTPYKLCLTCPAIHIICALYVTIYMGAYCPSRESQFCEAGSKPQNLTGCCAEDCTRST